MTANAAPPPAPETFLRVARSGPLRGQCRVPGDKSISHRALLFSALGQGEVTIEGLGRGEDNVSTARALAALGVKVTLDGDRASVHGAGFAGLSAPAAALDCGNSGTSIRLLCGLLAGRPFSSTLFGDASLSRRPMGRVARPLATMGARIAGRRDDNKPGEIYPPLVVQGGSLHGTHHELPVASAQLKTALVLAGLQASGVTSISEPGLSRDHTERMLSRMGAPLRFVDHNGRRSITVDPAGWNGRLLVETITVPGDLSSAAFIIAAAAMLPGSDVTVQGVGLNPTRTGVIDALRAMGANIETRPTGEALGEPFGDIQVRARPLQGARIDGELALRCLDEIPILAMAAATAAGTTQFLDLAELRVKESDRIAAVARELGRAGVAVVEQPAGLVVTGTPGGQGAGGFRGGRVQPDHDHRIAMSSAVLGLLSEQITEIPGADIGTSFPTFAQTLRELGGRVEVG